MFQQAFCVLFLLNFTFLGQSADLWSFRSDGLSNPKVSARFNPEKVATAPILTDFTVCLRWGLFHYSVATFLIIWPPRYRELYYNPDKNPTKFLRTVPRLPGQSFELNVYEGTNPNAIYIMHRGNKFRIVWFNSLSIIRQWISLCILHSMSQNKLQVYENKRLVYSTGGIHLSN